LKSASLMEPNRIGIFTRKREPSQLMKRSGLVLGYRAMDEVIKQF
jgi:hypothetical protein